LIFLFLSASRRLIRTCSSAEQTARAPSTIHGVKPTSTGHGRYFLKLILKAIQRERLAALEEALELLDTFSTDSLD
jgi:hypothetical protein